MTYLHLDGKNQNRVLFEPHLLWEDWLATVEWHLREASAAWSEARNREGLSSAAFGEAGRHIDRAFVIWHQLVGHDPTVTLKESNARLKSVKLNRKRKRQ